MVLRKPVPAAAEQQQASANPPYPLTPTSEQPPLASNPFGKQEDKTEPEAAESGVHTDSEWDTDGFDSDSDDDDRKKKKENLNSENEKEKEGEGTIPASLKVGGTAISPGKAAPQGELPMPLRVGPLDGTLRKTPEPQPQFAPASFGSAGSASSMPLQSHNPYLKLQHTGQQSVYGSENGSTVWGDSRTQTNPFIANSAPVELPTENSPVDQFSNLPFNNPTNAQLSVPESPSSKQPPLIPVSPDEPVRKLTRHDSDLSSAFNPGMDVSSLDAFSSRNHGLPQSQSSDSVQRTWQEQQAWERSERERKDRELAAAHEAAKLADDERRAEEEWHKGEAAAATAASVQQPPPRPGNTEQAPQKPPRPQIDTSRGASVQPQEVETPATKTNRQRKEHYQIKQIRWRDDRTGGIRQSPILVQNANGPCPLLALVNALVLSTPSTEETALIETLRTREQVTLGLLLDAVFDELMSGRRGGAAQELPDVGELYSFLVTLHTGMNINPCFVKPLDDTSNRNSGVFHPAVRGQAQPGGFEKTREMKLYSTFNIPLVHGWLPPGESHAYSAFNRVAKTYEDAHVIQFQEEELEAKLQSQGLNAEEQKLFEDLHTIKDFLERWPTQLTTFGLEVMATTLNPGQISILFRNDHFSTLYKEPRSGQIMTLVTDAGYARHDEIVWESLVDVNGQGSELFSGDFRPVGNMSEAAANGTRTGGNERPIRSLLDDEDEDDQGWTTVERRDRHDRPNAGSGQNPASRPPDPALMPDPLASSNDDLKKIEQEDHDLALALQLQEEEEDRHRRDMADRRRRENELNEQFLTSEQRTGNTGNGNNGNNGNNRNSNRPAIPPRRPHVSDSATPASNAAVDDAPPPTYEQAASGRPYHPPPGHPASPNAPMGGGRPTRPIQQNQSAYGQMSGQAGGSPYGAQHGRRRSGRHNFPQTTLIDQIPNGRVSSGGRRHNSGVAVNEQDKEKCTVM